MTVGVMLRGPLSDATIASTCDEVDRLLRAGRRVVVSVADCDLSVVDAVARLRVLARRRGGRLEVTGADAQLFAACGLDDLL